MADRWEELWRDGTTPWDLGDVSPPLAELLSTDTHNGESILVPGCGRGYDLLLLANHYKQVVGLDISETAVQTARHHCNQKGNITINIGDFFKCTTIYDAAFDYTFFCAIDPSQRDAWAAKMKRIIRNHIIAIVFPIIDAESRGTPPHPVKLDDYTGRLEPEFELVHLNRAPRSHASRLGKEMMAVFRRIEPL